MFQRILRLRPLLWIAGILLLAFLVSFTWEHQTSYDDGGIGSAAFAVLAPFAVAGQLVGLTFTASIVVSLLALVIGDLVATRKLAVGPRAT